MSIIYLRYRKVIAALMCPPWRTALLQHGVLAAVEHMDVLKSLRHCDIVIDVGANRGQFAIVAAECFPGAEIHVFEPIPSAIAVARQVVGPIASFHQLAVANHEGMVTFHLSRRDDSSSLLGTAVQTEVYPGTDHVGSIEVRSARLEGLIKPIEGSDVLLKIDVQGAESDVLKGAGDLLGAVRYIYVELSFVELYAAQPLAFEVIDFLRVRGFALRGIFNPTMRTRLGVVQADFLFERL